MTDLGLTPILDNVIIRPLFPRQQTKGGIHLPDSIIIRPTQGTVLVVGPGTFNKKTGGLRPMHVSVGDTVLFSRHQPWEMIINHNGEELYVIPESGILAQLTADSPKKEE